METAANAVTLKIEGMSGDACVQKVKSALAGVPGCKVESVKVGEAFCHCEDSATMGKACAAVKAAGYKATATRNDEQTDNSQSRESHAMTSEGAGGAVGENAGTVKAAPASAKKYA